MWVSHKKHVTVGFRRFRARSAFPVGLIERREKRERERERDEIQKRPMLLLLLLLFLPCFAWFEKTTGSNQSKVSPRAVVQQLGRGN